MITKRTKHLSILLMSAIMGLCLTSCENKKNDDNNELKYTKINELENYSSEITNTSRLNFSEAIIDIHNLDEACSLKLTRPALEMEKLTDEFKVNAEKFLDKTISEVDLKYRYTDENGDGSKQIGYNDSPKFDPHFTMLSYYDEETKDDIYFQPYAMYWVATKSSIYDKKIPLGEFGTLNFCDKNISETKSDIDFLTGKMTEIKNQYPFFLDSELLDTKPYRYIKVDDCYYTLLRMNYCGLPFNTDYFYSIEETGGTKWSLDSGTFGELVLDDNGEPYRIVSMANLDVEVLDTYNELITPDTACRLVDDIISDDVTFEVTRFELLYNYEQIILNDDRTDFYYQSSPYWKITIEKTGIPEYPQIAFMVNAVTGEVKTYKIG